MAIPRRLWRSAPETMAFRPGNYGHSLRRPASLLALRDVNGFKGVVFKVNNNKPPSSARCRLLIFLKAKNLKSNAAYGPKHPQPRASVDDLVPTAQLACGAAAGRRISRVDWSCTCPPPVSAGAKRSAVMFFGNHLVVSPSGENSRTVTDVACMHPFLALCHMTR